MGLTRQVPSRKILYRIVPYAELACGAHRLVQEETYGDNPKANASIR